MHTWGEGLVQRTSETGGVKAREWFIKEPGTGVRGKGDEGSAFP